jgi:uncharacterized membrane protein
VGRSRSLAAAKIKTLRAGEQRISDNSYRAVVLGASVKSSMAAPCAPSRQATASLFAAESASIVYAIATVLYGRLLPALLARNVIPDGPRNALSAAGALGCVVAAAVWMRSRTWSDSELEHAHRIARTLAPLLVAWAIAPLLCLGAFHGREIDLLILTGLSVVGLEAGVRVMPTRSAADKREQRASQSGWPWICVGIMVLAYAVLVSWGSIRLHDKLDTSLFDLGMFENLFWNALHGAQGLSADRMYFGEHAPLILYVLLPIYALVPRPETLLVMQSTLLGTAAIPLFLLARRCLARAWQAVVLVAAFLLYPALHGPNFYDFHFLTLSIFFVLWAACFFVFEKWWAFWIALVLALGCREDVSIGVAAVGLGLAWTRYKPRVGLVMAVVATAWFVVVKLVWMHSIASRDSFIGYYGGLVAPGQRGFYGVLVTLVSNPLYVIPQVLTREKLLLALQLLVPLAFLPVRRLKTAFLLLPGLLVIGLTTGAAALVQIHFQYVAHFVPYVFVAAVAALAPMAMKRRRAALAAVVLGSAVATVHFGALFRREYRVSFHYVTFSWTAQDAHRLDDLDSLIALIPPRASVAAGDAEGAHVARRPHLHGIKEGVRNADYILYGLASLRWGGAPQIIAALRSGKYGVVGRRGEFALLARGANTSGNVREAHRLMMIRR